VDCESGGASAAHSFVSGARGRVLCIFSLLFLLFTCWLSSTEGEGKPLLKEATSFSTQAAT